MARSAASCATAVPTGPAGHRIMVVYGTRPEAVKMAPLIHALAQSPLFTPLVAVTAQHRSMLDQVNDVFGIEPGFDLDIHCPGQTLADMTTRAPHGVQRVLAEQRPDAVVVQGDTATVFAAALAAFYEQIAVTHLEAGLRTHDPYSPYPEEINRRLATRLATSTGRPGHQQLACAAGDGTPGGVVGRSDADGRPRTGPHRQHTPRSSGGVPHSPQPGGQGRDPARRRASSQCDRGNPLPYGGFARLMNRAGVILTDSGGVQEEGPSLGKPVLVMRDTTERPEAVLAGTVGLVGTDENRIVETVSRLLTDPGAYAAMANAANPYGDGRAAGRAVAALAHHFRLGPPPDEFDPTASQVTTRAAPPAGALDPALAGRFPP
jgi:UDP-N-acetylglucosamine 2-epimerase (non-hydrolysing)